MWFRHLCFPASCWDQLRSNDPVSPSFSVTSREEERRRKRVQILLSACGLKTSGLNSCLMTQSCLLLVLLEVGNTHVSSGIWHVYLRCRRSLIKGSKLFALIYTCLAVQWLGLVIADLLPLRPGVRRKIILCGILVGHSCLCTHAHFTFSVTAAHLDVIHLRTTLYNVSNWQHR